MILIGCVFFTENRSNLLTFINQSYQVICEKYPSFRERSENVDLVVEISLQPWNVFKPDGVRQLSSTHLHFYGIVYFLCCQSHFIVILVLIY